MTFDGDMALSYLNFVVERHRVWLARQSNVPQPWTDDRVLAARKFTNVYRVLDPGSQFLLTDLFWPGDDPSPRDVLWRCFLYRYTNLPDTWRYLRECFDGYPTEETGTGLLVEMMQRRRDEGHKIFSGAYVILPQPNREGDKVVQAVELAARWMTNHADDFLAATSQQERFNILRREYGVGPFLAMQILTDWGYSPYGADVEDEFVIPGPGCIKGTQFVDPQADPMDVLMWAVDAVRSLPDCPELPLDNPMGMGRPPSWMDIQNTFCEFSKYVRFQRRGTGLEKPYHPAHPGPQPTPILPAHW